jgi:cell division protein FtsQ
MKLKKFKEPKINWTRLWFVWGWIISISALFLTLGFVGKEKNSVKCKVVSISITDESGNEFITENDVLDLLNSNGKQPVGKTMNDINIGLLEKLVNSNPFVANAEVFSTINGEVNIDIRQRVPIIRIINGKDEHFYIDDQGEFMPVSQNYTAPLMVANGFIFDTYSERKVPQYNIVTKDSVETKPMITQIFELAQFITNDQFWNAQIEQIYVSEQLEIELIPRVGNHRIILGDATELDQKFKKLMIFYKQGLNKIGWNNYSVINLKYTNQVVCTKIVNSTNIRGSKPN